MIMAKTNLDLLLSYELRSASRYRRFASLVMITGAGREAVNIKELLTDKIRGCDEFLEIDNCAAVLMSETDRNGALKAIARYKTKCASQVDLRFAVATFPFDGLVPMSIMSNVNKRLNAAKGLDRGAVVSEG
jgi:hypothetical protein